MATPAQPVDAAPVGHPGAAIQITERPAASVNGWWIIAGLVVAFLIAAAVQVPALLVVVLVLAGISLTSFVVIAPGQTRVVQFFGQYVGTMRKPGLTAVLPFTVRR